MKFVTRERAQVENASDRELRAESAGLYAIASGFHAMSPLRFEDDHALLEAESPIYDALYEFCRARVSR